MSASMPPPAAWYAAPSRSASAVVTRPSSGWRSAGSCCSTPTSTRPGVHASPTFKNSASRSATGVSAGTLARGQLPKSAAYSAAPTAAQLTGRLPGTAGWKRPAVDARSVRSAHSSRISVRPPSVATQPSGRLLMRSARQPSQRAALEKSAARSWRHAWLKTPPGSAVQYAAPVTTVAPRESKHAAALVAPGARVVVVPGHAVHSPTVPPAE